MSGYYSTQTSIENRISASRLAGFIDRDGDGSPDSGPLTAGFIEARAIIRGYLKRDYDTDTIDAWTDTTCPEIINMISDWLCIRLYYVNNPRFQEAAQIMYDRAIAMLKEIRNGEMDIYSLDRDTSHIDDLIQTDTINSDFDPERELDDMTVRTTWILPDNRELDNY
jgi:phage gp36-like protein